MDKNRVKRVSHEEVVLIQGNEGYLGKGTYGHVKIGFYSCYDAVAVKSFFVLQSSEKSKKRIQQKIDKELSILHQLNHKNIVPLYAWCLLENAVALIMEYLPIGNLWEVVSDPDVPLTLRLRLRMCSEIADGMAFAHKLPDGDFIVHGELNGENVLLTEDLRCKITDFSNRRLLQCKNNTELNHLKDPFKQVFVAPELLSDPAASLTRKHDVYSFGTLLYELITRCRFIEDYAQLDVYLRNVKRGNKNVLPNIDSMLLQTENEAETDLIINNVMVEVLKQCWSFDPHKRPGMEQVKKKLNSIFNWYKNNEVFADVLAALESLGDVKPVTDVVNCSPLSYSGSRSRSGSTISSRASISSNVSSSSMFSFAFRQRKSNSISNCSSQTNSTPSLVRSYKMRKNLKSPFNVEAGRCLIFNEWKNTVSVYDAIGHRVISQNETLLHKHYGGSIVKHNSSCYIISGFNSHKVEKSQTTGADLSWSLVGPTIETRWQAASTLCNDWIYVTGGYEGITRLAKSSAERFEPGRNQWFPIKPMNVGRFGHALVTMRGLVFAIGGEENNSAEFYDHREGGWTNISAMKSKRGGVTAAVLYDQIYGIGGYNSSGDLRSVEAYNPFTTKWTMVGELNSARRYHGSCTAVGKIVAVGGAQGAKLLEIVEMYDPDDDRWITVQNIPAFQGGLSITPYLK